MPPENNAYPHFIAAALGLSDTPSMSPILEFMAGNVTDPDPVQPLDPEDWPEAGR
ncbi:MAG: hypothetical protein U1E27_08320 [Kiritimatiellia bacterium]|nr:hypothetical protein [Kiritimatiellia bacterium]